MKIVALAGAFESSYAAATNAQLASTAKSVCTAVVANVTSQNP
jgi:hypothetical protein